MVLLASFLIAAVSDLPKSLAEEYSFVWAWMAAFGATTKTVSFGPGVTCPSFRYHPAVIAQAAATQAAMTPGRFWLGLGSGEALNEQVVELLLIAAVPPAV